MTAILIALALQGAPLAPAVAADARCVLIFGSVRTTSTPEQQATARAGVLYYVGKMRGRQPGVDVAGTIRRAAEQARTSNLKAQAEVARCTGEAESAGKALGALRSAPNKP